MNQQKIYNITAEFNLTKKPSWLDDFRLKYDKPFRYHITFKTSSYVDTLNINKLKAELLKITLKNKIIKVNFSNLFINTTSTGGCIMIEAENNEKLNNLQKEITKKTSKFGMHISKEYKTFENNFTPHTTIARHLTPNLLMNAKNEIQKNLECESLINELVLTVVNKDIFTEWKDKQNKSFYKLS